MRPASLQSLQTFQSRAEKFMHRFLLPGVAIVVLYAAMTGCASDLSRGIAYCQDNFFGFERITCEQQVRNRFGPDSHY